MIISPLKISLLESILGKDIVIPYFNGDITINTDTLTLGNVIQPQKEYFISGKGMKSSGNLVIIFEIN